MGDRSNVSHRVLNTVRTTTGAARSLENFIGLALVDGAQCFVIEEEANYRWLAESTLVADGRFVVKASGPNEQGRWVRESASVGFALLEEAECAAVNSSSSSLSFSNYAHQQLVQFEMLDAATLVYRGRTKRLAMLFGKACLLFNRSSLSLGILVEQDSKPPVDAIFSNLVTSQRLEMSGTASVSGSVFLEPGDRLSLKAFVSYDSADFKLALIDPSKRGTHGSLRVVLA